MNSSAKFLLLVAIAVAGLFSFGACASSSADTDSDATRPDTMITTDNLPENQATAVFAMGCFWCAEADFEKVDGVLDVVSGYTGGTTVSPTYEEVTYERTGHYEAVLVTYDTTKVRYGDLLAVFWKNVDPFDDNGQFCDKGSSYRAAVFPGSDAERDAAEASKVEATRQLGKDIVTAINDRAEFYAAEEYHQDYYKKNPVRYAFYRSRCGRDERLEAVWGDIK
ncbi:MAG: peptide-methionine (S)-S-oxide reductase MsrA [Erythrobacter sp.]|nr:peptide-methionine (S)-S-oxide reductase MsrA [Erythrobacter sp.]